MMSFETGRLAKQAGGAVTIRYGDLVLLSTATASKEPRQGVDFLPLTVDVAEKAYAAGKMPGGFFKREGRPNSEAILAARLCDRPLRPLFPKNYHNETQLIITILAADEVNPHAPLGIVGASAALAISDIPFDDPVGACNIGYIDGELVVNPTYEELETSALELTVAGTADAIMMVEAGANFVSEEVILEALKLAQEVNGEIVSHIREIQAEVGKTKWAAPEASEAELEAKAATQEHVGDAIKEALKLGGGKEAREDAIREIMSEAKSELTSGDQAHDALHVQTELYSLEKEAVRESILAEDRRPDGRVLERIATTRFDGGVPSAGSRLWDIPARRDTSSRRVDAGFGRGCAAPGQPFADHDEALYASLQLPAVLDRRSWTVRIYRSTRSRSRNVG